MNMMATHLLARAKHKARRGPCNTYSTVTYTPCRGALLLAACWGSKGSFQALSTEY